MEKDYKYFIENEKGEWYRFNPNLTFKFHVTSSNMDYRCSCDYCTGNGKNFYEWTINPLEAAAFPKQVIEQLNNMLLREQFKNCKITEHEFI